MEKWLSKNLKWITLILLFLLCIKTFQSCTRKTSLRIQEKKLTHICDSIIGYKNIVIDSLQKSNLEKYFLIIDLKNELKVAGVKYDEAQKRADAIQKTAAAIRANTTIEIKGAEKEEKDTPKK